jgi:hypothetical protein
MTTLDKKNPNTPSSPTEYLDTTYRKQQAYFEALQTHPDAIETALYKGHVVTCINFSKLGIEGLKGCVASVYNEKTEEYETRYSSKKLVSLKDYLL